MLAAAAGGVCSGSIGGGSEHQRRHCGHKLTAAGGAEAKNELEEEAGGPGSARRAGGSERGRGDGQRHDDTTTVARLARLLSRQSWGPAEHAAPRFRNVLAPHVYTDVVPMSPCPMSLPPNRAAAVRSWSPISRTRNAWWLHLSISLVLTSLALLHTHLTTSIRNSIRYYYTHPESTKFM